MDLPALFIDLGIWLAHSLAFVVAASLLVPAYHAAFIALPVLWQALLLPGCRLSWLTGLGLALILAGVAAMQAVGRTRR